MKLQRDHRGAITLFVATIMLLLITLLLAVSYRQSIAGLQVLGNEQSRSQARAVARAALEEIRLQDTLTWINLESRRLTVDIDQDGRMDFSVLLPAPQCLQATRAPAVIAAVEGEAMPQAAGWNTRWQFRAIATDLVHGSRVDMVEAANLRLSDAQLSALCLASSQAAG